MHHKFPDIVQDDIQTLTYEGSVYKCRKGTWADKQFFLDCHEDEPLEVVQERLCQTLNSQETWSVHKAKSYTSQ